MSRADFRELRERAMGLYGEGKYAQALSLLEAEWAKYPEQAGRTYNWRACLAALTGRPEQAIQILQEGLEAGCWWQDEALRDDPDLASLQGRPDFERIAAINAAKQAQAQAASKPELLVFAPQAGTEKAFPLLLVMHGRNSSARETAPYWQAASAQGWIVALAQSSQVLGSDLFGWDDLEQGLEEVQAHYASLAERFPLDPQRVVLGGFSQGGGLAILLAANGAIPASGFIAVAPYMRQPERLEAALSAGQQPDLCGRIILGERDNTMEVAQKILATLKAHQIPVEVETHPGLGHEYPAGFEERVTELLAFAGKGF